ncbi:MAG: AAA family ATPase [Streptosporangiales bacterium]|nr:AAA family ATPase [Streptosporangiales bacterium]
MTGEFRHGLVIGKFYPPHRGHEYLIGRAAAACEAVTVLVMAAAHESVPLADRVAWLREAFAAGPGVSVLGAPCDAPVDYGDRAVWAAQVAVMRAALAVAGRPPVDAVFASESYGAELADWFGARAVSVDPARSAVPVSGTAVRSGLAEYWDFLSPPVRAGLAARIVVVGAESTGTTTVARDLADHFRNRGGAWARTRCVPEHGRDYTGAKWEMARAAAAAAGQEAPDLQALVWTREDFDAVADGQTRREEAAAREGSPVLVCDTDAFATSVWERRYLGEDARAVGSQPWAAAPGLPRHDVYLLTAHEGVPWDDDGMREGDLEIRAAMTGWFALGLTRAGHSWVLLSGSREERLRLAARTAESVLSRRTGFGAAAGERTP